VRSPSRRSAPVCQREGRLRLSANSAIRSNFQSMRSAVSGVSLKRSPRRPEEPTRHGREGEPRAVSTPRHRAVAWQALSGMRPFRHSDDCPGAWLMLSSTARRCQCVGVPGATCLVDPGGCCWSASRRCTSRCCTYAGFRPRPGAQQPMQIGLRQTGSRQTSPVELCTPQVGADQPGTGQGGTSSGLTAPRCCWVSRPSRSRGRVRASRSPEVSLGSKRKGLRGKPRAKGQQTRDGPSKRR